jgi:hypothetical protein
MTVHRTNEQLSSSGLVDRLNGAWHRPALAVFLLIVLAHWAEHVAQAVQIYALNWSVPDARGVLGIWFPWLVKQEWLHYGYALVMLIGLWSLRHAFAGAARTWWLVALGIQIWHHFEHLLLLVQAQAGAYLFGKAAPTSIIQLLVPRVELHLFYNAAVFLPMVVGMYLHRTGTGEYLRCTCAVRPVAAASTPV